MAQILKGSTYAENGEVTYDNLNKLVDDAILLPGAVTGRGDPSALQSSDTLLLHDNSASALKTLTLETLYGSPLAIGGTTPAAGAFTTVSSSGAATLASLSVTGDATIGSSTGTVATAARARAGTTATVTTATAHLLKTGDTVNISGLPSAYNGTGIEVTVTGATTFTYSVASGDETTTADTAGTVTLPADRLFVNASVKFARAPILPAMTFDSLTTHSAGESSKWHQSGVVDKGDSGTGSVELDWAAGEVFTLKLTGTPSDITFANAASGRAIILVVTQDATGTRVLNSSKFPTILWSGGASSATATATASAVTIYSITRIGTNYFGVCTKGYSAT